MLTESAVNCAPPMHTRRSIQEYEKRFEYQIPAADQSFALSTSQQRAVHSSKQKEEENCENNLTISRDVDSCARQHAVNKRNERTDSLTAVDR